MNFAKLTGFLAVLVSTQSFGYQLNCISDYRAVDGGLTQVLLNVTGDGRGTARIIGQHDSPAVSHQEKTTIRALQCENLSQAGELSINCTGPFQVNVSEMELVQPPPGGFTREVKINTTLNDGSYTFKKGPIGTGAIKNGCELTQ